jgi:hypothetical protein
VIAITLNFKSIEAARQALLDIPSSALVGGSAPEAKAETAKESAAPKETAARKAAPAATSPATATKPAASDEKTPASDTSATTSSAAASGASEGNAAAGSSAQEAPAASTASSSAPVEYPLLQKAVFALAGKSREAAAAVAAGFGVKTFKELPADKWGEALGAVQEKLAELESA